MDLRDSPDAGGSVRREQGEVRSMAGPVLAVVVVLILVSLSMWVLIWGRNDPPSTVTIVRDTGPTRLRARQRSEQ
jgi:hypothetical protein